MLPSRKQETGRPPSSTTDDRTNDSNELTNNKSSSNIRTTLERCRQLNIRPKNRQLVPGYHPYDALDGKGYKHRKHRSQPVNLLNDDALYLNAARALVMQSVAGNMSASAHSNENDRTARYGDHGRSRSMSQTTVLPDTLLNDVTESVKNSQVVSQPESIRP